MQLCHMQPCPMPGLHPSPSMCMPAGGGRNPITNRYARHFHVLHVTEFDVASQVTNGMMLVTRYAMREA